VPSLDEIDWAALDDAYGSAAKIPELLRRAEADTRHGHVTGSTWFELWSSLCHQGDIYTASYAALPFLIRLAEQPNYQTQYDPLLLAASIDVSRSEGERLPPDFPLDLVIDYRAALKRGAALASAALKRHLDTDARRALQGCVAAFLGQHLTARNIWDDDAQG